MRTIKFGHHLMISELVWLGVLEWTVYHALIINVDYRAGWIISISTNRSFIYILTYLASQWQLSSTACVPRFALFYWCTWFMKQVLQVSQSYVLYIFKCMIFFSKRNFFRIVFHKMMIAWADLSKQNKNFPLFGS